MTLTEAQERTKKGTEIKLALHANEKIKISIDGTKIANGATLPYLEWVLDNVETTAPTLVTGKDHFTMFERVISVSH